MKDILIDAKVPLYTILNTNGVLHIILHTIEYFSAKLYCTHYTVVVQQCNTRINIQMTALS